MSRPQIGRETHEIVVNWDDGQDVQVEAVSLASLHRPTRTYFDARIPRLLTAMAVDAERREAAALATAEQVQPAAS